MTRQASRARPPTRLAGIPVEHVTAELAAFPLASEAALEIAPTALSPDVETKTARLWRAAETEILRSCPAFSVAAVSVKKKNTRIPFPPSSFVSASPSMCKPAFEAQ